MALPQRESYAVKRLPFTAAMLLAVVAGCSEPEGQVVQTMRPQVHWEHVATVPVEGVDDTFANLVPDGTDGVFPTSIAVARVAVGGQNSEDAAGRVMMDMSPSNDFLSWNGLLDNLRYVSEVFPLRVHDLGEEPPSAARIVSAADELNAGLCLVYGRGDVSETEAEVRGVLYQASTGKALAAVHARVLAPVPDEIERPPEQVSGDNRHCDARVLAEARFERLVLECVRDLRRGDRAVIIEPPAGWTPDEPLDPRSWPPPPFGRP